jgi:hypothetical protein
MVGALAATRMSSFLSCANRRCGRFRRRGGRHTRMTTTCRDPKLKTTPTLKNARGKRADADVGPDLGAVSDRPRGTEDMLPGACDEKSPRHRFTHHFAEAFIMSSIGSVSAAPIQRQAAPIARATDADGDHDGSTKAAPAATKPAAPPLAQSGTVGRHVNTTA